MIFEPLGFYFCLILLAAWLLWIDGWRAWTIWRQDRYLTRTLRPLEHREVARAEALFGRPSEVVPGSNGRRLYVWKGPSMPGHEARDRLVIVTMTVSDLDLVDHAVFEPR